LGKIKILSPKPIFNGTDCSSTQTCSPHNLPSAVVLGWTRNRIFWLGAEHGTEYFDWFTRWYLSAPRFFLALTRA